VVFAVLCLVTSVVNPLGEAYDEWAHFAYIRYIATEHRLPASGQRLVPEVGWDATHHPPVYYVIGALATSWVDMSDNLRPITNPHLSSGRSYNAYIHTAAEDWPYRGSALGMHVARAVSTAMGLITLWLTYQIALLLAPRRPGMAVLAMATTAAIPQFVFTHSIVTNDAGVTLFATLALWFMVRLLLRPTLSNQFGMWLAIAAAFMSKANAVGLIPVGAVVTLWAMWRNRERAAPRAIVMRALLGTACLASALALLLGWETTNTYLRGHHSSVTGALSRYILPVLTGSVPDSLVLFDWSVLLPGLSYTYRTFWAAFGLGNVPADEVLYWLAGAFTVLGLVGIVRTWRRIPREERWRARLPALVALALATPSVFLIPVSQLVFVAPGRYLMPLAPLAGLALAVGLSAALPGPRRYLVPGLAVAVLLVFSVAAPWRYIRPAYARARLLTPEQATSLATPIHARFGQAMELIGYAVQGELAPGGFMEVDLYWHCLAPMATDYSVAVQALDPERRFYGGTVNYPGRGSYPTSLWQPGQIIEDRHRFTLGADLPVPTYVQIQVDVLDLDTGAYLPVSPATEPGQRSVLAGRLPVPDREAQRVRVTRPMATYGDRIELARSQVEGIVQPGATLEMRLVWRCRAALDQDYTVFVHLLDEDGHILAQADGPPVSGRYPTSLWSPREQVPDIRRLEIPASADAGSLRLAVGWYLLGTGERLPAHDASGEPLPNAQLLIPVSPSAPQGGT